MLVDSFGFHLVIILGFVTCFSFGFHDIFLHLIFKELGEVGWFLQLSRYLLKFFRVDLNEK